MLNEWYYKGKKKITPEEGYYGFTYCIKYLGPDTPEYPTGAIYIGKKAFTHKKRTKLSKKAKLLPENKGKRILRATKDSGWRDYYGSSKELTSFIAKVGKENFSREILTFSKTKARNTYEELQAQINFKVLEIPSFNRWVGGKVWRYQLQEK